MRPPPYSAFAPWDVAYTTRHDANLSFVSGLRWLSQNDGQTRLDAGNLPQGFPNRSEATSRGGHLRPSAIPVPSMDPTIIVGSVCLRTFGRELRQ
jgi:hypothetical protein